MRKGGKVDLVISIVLAIVIWGYVIGVVDPTTQTKISNVPIAYVNEETLNAAGLEIDAPEKATVSVVIKGDRSDVKKVEKSDIIATVDVADLSEGENEAEIMVSVPSTVTYVRQDEDALDVTVKKIQIQTDDSNTEPTEQEQTEGVK